jgi:hypothetical protein
LNTLLTGLDLDGDGQSWEATSEDPARACSAQAIPSQLALGVLELFENRYWKETE